METILNLIHPIFTNNGLLQKWLPNIKSNTIRYQNSWDEFVITYIPNTAEFEVTVPLKDVFYKNKFNNLTSAADYIQMHLNYYQKRI